ncbi:phasin family protein [Altererythrobacter sp. BO-6]|uniref:phasin family protein n=1 Tax=Altererythrobacter sp. BO-6 TaxID=2604537 RepID=UPI0013E19ED4|nr:phasin family protein [Altererythrobacter sp. BO-6]QIG53813.1 phasin family protein [Altererythrobacter sp. BO-6]
MAEQAKAKIDAAAEKAYAEAAAKKTVSETAVEEAIATDAPKAPVKVAAVKKAVKAPAKKTTAKKAAPKKAAVKKTVTKKAAPKKVAAKKAAPKKTAKAAAKTAAPANPFIQVKDKIMATAKTTDFTATAKEFLADAQTRAKTAFAKTGELASEVTEFNKGNLEAVVESGKIFFNGVQSMGREQVEATKTVVETVTADFKKMAAVKSPTELVQLQGELARRNFDAAVSFGSKNTEALVKLYNEAFAPISSRMSLAAEKIKKAA